MSGVAKRSRATSPAEITHPAVAEAEMRREQAVLDIMRRGRADLKEQAVVLRRIVEYAVRGADLVDEMREAGELAEHGDNQWTSEVRTSTLETIGLNRQRVSEWRSLRDHDALGFLDRALADARENTLRKASINWLRARCERIDREDEAADTPEPAYDSELRHGDLRTVLDDLAGQVDVIITDPPYPAEFIDEFDALGEVAARLLTPDGLLVAMVGHTHLPAYLERLARHLTYRWTGAYLMHGPAARVFGRSVGTKWKPLLIFDRDNERRFITQDVFVSASAEKSIEGQIDGWAQSETGMLDIVEHLSEPGDLVVDPFMGGGTTGLACKVLGRRFVGCDRDADAVRIARERLA